MTATTTTGPLTSGSSTLAVTLPGVIAGGGNVDGYGNPQQTGIPVFLTAVNGSVSGVYLVPSNDFVGSFILSRHVSGIQAAGSETANGNAQRILAGDHLMLFGAGNAPAAKLTSTDQVTLTITGCKSGSLTLSVVQ